MMVPPIRATDIAIASLETEEEDFASTFSIQGMADIRNDIDDVAKGPVRTQIPT